MNKPPLFVKRHYQFLVEFLRDNVPNLSQRIIMAEDLANRLAADNPKFARNFFLKAVCRDS